LAKIHGDKEGAQFANLVQGVIQPELAESLPEGARRDVILVWNDKSPRLVVEARTSRHVHELAVDGPLELLEDLVCDRPIGLHRFYTWRVRPKTDAELEFDRLAAAERGFFDMPDAQARVSLQQISQMIAEHSDVREPVIRQGSVILTAERTGVVQARIDTAERSITACVTAAGWRPFDFDGCRWFQPRANAQAFGRYFAVKRKSAGVKATCSDACTNGVTRFVSLTAVSFDAIFVSNVTPTRRRNT
jgi:hypothetical protein